MMVGRDDPPYNYPPTRRGRFTPPLLSSPRTSCHPRESGDLTTPPRVPRFRGDDSSQCGVSASRAFPGIQKNDSERRGCAKGRPRTMASSGSQTGMAFVQCGCPTGCPARGATPGSARPAPRAGASRPPSGRALPSSLRSDDEDVQLNPAEHRGAGNGRFASIREIHRGSFDVCSRVSS